MGTGLAVPVPVFVAEAYAGGAGDAGRYCVLCLGDGILDKAACGGFVDCELACVRSSF
jgi:hypothetical protein